MNIFQKKHNKLLYFFKLCCYFTTSKTATGGTGDNRIEFVTIATTGNAFDFGDTTSGQDHARGASLSDSHGGLGGF